MLPLCFFMVKLATTAASFPSQNDMEHYERAGNFHKKNNRENQ